MQAHCRSGLIYACCIVSRFPQSIFAALTISVTDNLCIISRLQRLVFVIPPIFVTDGLLCLPMLFYPQMFFRLQIFFWFFLFAYLPCVPSFAYPSFYESSGSYSQSRFFNSALLPPHGRPNCLSISFSCTNENLSPSIARR